MNETVYIKSARKLDKLKRSIKSFFNANITEHLNRLPKKRRELKDNLLVQSLYEITNNASVLETLQPQRSRNASQSPRQRPLKRKAVFCTSDFDNLRVAKKSNRIDLRFKAAKARAEELHELGPSFFATATFLSQFRVSESEPPSPNLAALVGKKQFLTSGIYSSERKGGIGLYEKRHFKWTYPKYINGLAGTNWKEEFQLPYDISVWLSDQGGYSQLEQLRGSSRVPPRYQKISRNVYPERTKRRAKDYIPCDCNPEAGQRCGDDCYNRCMFIECLDGQCACAEQCTNRRFQKRAFVSSLEVYWTGSRGFGVRTLASIPKGTLVLEYLGEVISVETCHSRINTAYKDLQNYYMLHYADDEVIDGTKRGNDARFINHSCSPNCAIEKWVVDGEYAVGVVAICDIEPGAELSYDYRFRSFGRMQRCFCMSANCRGFLGVNQKQSLPVDMPKTKHLKADTRAQHIKERQKHRIANLRDVLKDNLVYRQYLLRKRVFLLRNYTTIAPKLLLQRVASEAADLLKHEANQRPRAQLSSLTLTLSQKKSIQAKILSIELQGQTVSLLDLFTPSEQFLKYRQSQKERQIPAKFTESVFCREDSENDSVGALALVQHSNSKKQKTAMRPKRILSAVN